MKQQNSSIPLLFLYVLWYNISLKVFGRNCPTISKPFDTCFEEISVCFDAITKLVNASKEIVKYKNIVKLVVQ